MAFGRPCGSRIPAPQPMLVRSYGARSKVNALPGVGGTRFFARNLWVLGFVCSSLVYAEGQTETTLVATVSEDLTSVTLESRVSYTPSKAEDPIRLILAADRYRRVNPALLPSSERSFFPLGYDTGGFEALKVGIDGKVCRPRFETLDGQERVAVCPAKTRVGQAVGLEISATLDVPERTGPFGRHGRQLTLASGWAPYVSAASPGALSVALRVPAGTGVVLGNRFFPAVPSRSEGRGTRVLRVRQDAATEIPLVVLPYHAGVVPLLGGRGLLITRSARAFREGTSPRIQELVASLEDGLRFLKAQGFHLPERAHPLLLVEAPLRHNLARSTSGPVLVSDRAFQLLPFDRFYRFHRFPILRELFTRLALNWLGPDRKHQHVMADAIGAWLVDRYVVDRFGSREDAFDVLSLWSFIPAVDSLLYAPQLPFAEAYFRFIREDDPLRPNLIDFPSPAPRGKVVYEKLLDRVGAERAAEVMFKMLDGHALRGALATALKNKTDGFLNTWLGSYPEVQYRLAKTKSRTADPALCGRDARRRACFVAEAVVERLGALVEEPLEVRFTDKSGQARSVWSQASSARLRVVTATLGAALDLVELDPRGRTAETPSEANPSPRFDNRSSPRWRVLLNNFNLLVSPSAGTVDTAVDVGASRVRDVRWRYALRGAYQPESVSLTSRASYRFGPAITPDRLSRWVGLALGVDYLRPGFANSANGAWATSATLFVGSDNRTTVWAPESGEAFGLAASFSHVLGGVATLLGEKDGVSSPTRDALAVTGRVLKSWRFGGAHQLSLRANAGAFVLGRPRSELLFSVGGRRNVRGYARNDALGRLRAIGSVEWVHPVLPNLNTNGFHFAWVSGVDGAMYADIAVLGDDVGELNKDALFGDIGYGLRIYLDYFGVRRGVMSLDVAFKVVGPDRRVRLGSPAIYLDFAQSFLVF